MSLRQGHAFGTLLNSCTVHLEVAPGKSTDNLKLDPSLQLVLGVCELGRAGCCASVSLSTVGKWSRVLWETVVEIELKLMKP